ncbi:MAG TPA: hypothetical protein VGL65_09760 [Gemmatimonadales bacterium]|jgi:hypothetical protein
MRYALALSALVAACSGLTSKVDPQLVGTWELMVPNADGVARWVWEIRGNGTYAFHAEGPGSVPPHSGVFAARNGSYTLESTTIAWADTGTYLAPHDDTLNATGKLGTGSWHRVRLGVNAPPPAPAVAPPPPSPDTEPAPRGKPAIFEPSGIYAYLRTHSMDASAFTGAVTVSPFTTVSLDNEFRRNGEIGAVRAVVSEDGKPDDQVEFRIFRDRAATEAVYRTLTDLQAPGFPHQRGEFIATSEFTFHEFGISHCLSRYIVGGSAAASVTCYLLIIDPTEEAVMIVGQTSERPASGSNQASDAAFSRADDLILAGLKHWDVCRLGIAVLDALH